MIDPEVKKVSATADTFVHYLFATPQPQNEQMLLSFVNAVRDNMGQPPVKQIEVRTPFNPGTFPTDKQTILDINAVAENDQPFIIEFQVANHAAFDKRALYYWAKAYDGQMKKGVSYNKLAPVVMMLITRFVMFPEHDELHNAFKITNESNSKFVFTDDLQIHTLELADARLDQLPTLHSPLRWWLEFFYYADQKSEAEMKELHQESDLAVQQAYDEYLQFNQSKELRQVEADRQKFLHDYTTDIEDAEEKGLAKGLAKGRAEGVAETILYILSNRFQVIPKPLEEQILAIKDLECLKKLVVFASGCKSLDEFATAAK